ncbi:cobyrinate a,c-diamide synthase [Paenibacillus sp. ACRSA]|uniref:cobyrinate a,c-diamide synthase n=1 Tax=Paenibacillus sp. ACRSA TaxID=2918211 RepID=UPI001EF4395E|nr:cobyrinate a,c-diamide synthase [Paenibacillus sp. ACRSA]MCG7380697.1 cobyrinate a,c-diamide synthase [Paenibacillus sp. ACRSA]
MITSDKQHATHVRPRLIIAGTGSGAGKTTVTLGLMKALAGRGLRVQGFKCGPDYIDPTYHTAVTGRASRNLDAWMTSPEYVRHTFVQAAEGQDISIIEGVMGLYDGKDPLSNTGSTAEIAMVTQTPVILVVDVRSMARSAAAIVLGFQQLEPELNIAGVIVNRCGSAGHYQIVKKAIEQMCDIPVVGWLKREDDMSIPERHLGLVPAIERGELDPLFQRAADVLSEGTDLDLLLKIAGAAPPLKFKNYEHQEHQKDQDDQDHQARPVIAIARDAAFNFYYPDNLELLEEAGAKLTYFSPIAGEGIPADADSIYLGGGFPEEFAEAIATNKLFLGGLRQAARQHMPLFAECGGYMVLAETLTDRQGVTFNMAGIVPAHVQMQTKRAALGYREASAVQDSFLLEKGDILRGHEFHYSTMTYHDSDTIPYAYETKGMRGLKPEGYNSGHILAGYTHVHLASNPAAAHRWVERCRMYRQSKQKEVE